jgi:hypothetical protein
MEDRGSLKLMQTNPTAYADINELLEILSSSMQKILGEKLIGLYPYGSLVIGDFDPTISDIDLVTALSIELDTEYEALQTMHDEFAHKHKEWDGRIEVCYVSLAALQTVKTRTSLVANISPGEPFHTRETSFEWLVSWYSSTRNKCYAFWSIAKNNHRADFKRRVSRCNSSACKSVG